MAAACGGLMSVSRGRRGGSDGRSFHAGSNRVSVAWCSVCGSQAPPNAGFCPSCGTPVRTDGRPLGSALTGRELPPPSPYAAIPGPSRSPMSVQPLSRGVIVLGTWTTALAWVATGFFLLAALLRAMVIPLSSDYRRGSSGDRSAMEDAEAVEGAAGERLQLWLDGLPRDGRLAHDPVVPLFFTMHGAWARTSRSDPAGRSGAGSSWERTSY